MAIHSTDTSTPLVMQEPRLPRFLVYDINHSDIMFECETLVGAVDWRKRFDDADYENDRDLVIYELVIEEK